MADENEQGAEPAESPQESKPEPKAPPAEKTWLNRALDWIEVAGNKLPDPAVLFLILMIATWIVSAILAPIEFT
ncbi:MAG: hypothetical protein GY720_22705, partial [bacterium]|nr:hypothetical protein [bacterium]